MPENDEIQNILSELEIEASQPGFYKSVESVSKKASDLADDENRGILGMRKMWSMWVLILISVIIAFDIALVSFYGFGVWDFKDSNVVIVVITENFLKIFALGYVITQNIFKKIF